MDICLAAFLVSNGNINENYKSLIFSLVLLSIEQHLKTITFLQQQKSLGERDLAAAAAQDLYSRLVSYLYGRGYKTGKIIYFGLLFKDENFRNSEGFAKLIFFSTDTIKKYISHI